MTSIVLSDYLKMENEKINVNNVNVDEITELVTPKKLKEDIISENILKFVNKTRNEISDILNGRSDRKIIVVGPCSIHNIEAAKKYGLQLKSCQIL